MSKISLNDCRMDTKLIHVGHKIDPVTRSMADPIFQTATYGFDTVEEMDAAWEKLRYVYTREGNPTEFSLEEKLAAIEGGEAALTMASGMGAVCSTLLTLLNRGDHLICAQGLFSHSTVFLNELIEKLGIELDFADFKDIEDVTQKIKPNTSIFFRENPENPTRGIVDIEAVAKIAKSNNCLFIVDSTFAPPPVQQPLKWGADLVIHSLTKYINGHGDALGGAVIGRRDIIEKIKWPGMPCFTGASLSPFNAWLIMRGMTTLEMRVEKQMNGMGGGIVSFWLKNGINGMSVREADYKFCDALEIITIATSLGEAHTLIQVEKSNMIRIAIGLENPKDLIEDLKQALEAL